MNFRRILTLTMGTIVMIQSPIGTNYLDATTLVEGFAWFIQDSSGGQASGTQIPGLGLVDAGFPTFSQPKGVLRAGAIYAANGFSTSRGHQANMTFTYRVF